MDIQGKIFTDIFQAFVLIVNLCRNAKGKMILSSTCTKGGMNIKVHGVPCVNLFSGVTYTSLSIRRCDTQCNI